MANTLKMAIVQSIQQLHAAGWSQRRIARELEIDRGTVTRHLRLPSPEPKPAILPAGFSPADDSNAATFSPLPAPASSTSVAWQQQHAKQYQYAAEPANKRTLIIAPLSQTTVSDLR